MKTFVSKSYFSVMICVRTNRVQFMRQRLHWLHTKKLCATFLVHKENKFKPMHF